MGLQEVCEASGQLIFDHQDDTASVVRKALRCMEANANTYDPEVRAFFERYDINL
jgi:hypothetical protein